MMDGMASDDDFYEDDEPIEDIEAIIARGPDGYTARPDGVSVTIGTGKTSGVITASRFREEFGLKPDSGTSTVTAETFA